MTRGLRVLKVVSRADSLAVRKGCGFKSRCPPEVRPPDDGSTARADEPDCARRCDGTTRLDVEFRLFIWTAQSNFAPGDGTVITRNF